MKKYLFICSMPFILVGCFNERGVSLKYYNECEEYYDMQGYYHTKCDKNLIDYSDIAKALEPAQNPSKGSVR